PFLAVQSGALSGDGRRDRHQPGGAGPAGGPVAARGQPLPARAGTGGAPVGFAPSPEGARPAAAAGLRRMIWEFLRVACATLGAVTAGESPVTLETNWRRVCQAPCCGARNFMETLLKQEVRGNRDGR